VIVVFCRRTLSQWIDVPAGQRRYLIDEIMEDVGSGHNVVTCGPGRLLHACLLLAPAA